MAEESDARIPRVDVDSALEAGKDSENEITQEWIEKQKLDGEGQVRSSYLNDQSQKRSIRERVVNLAIGVISFMGIILLLDVVSTIFGWQEAAPDSVRVALLVTPAVSITTITIFLLVGAFRGFKPKDFDSFPINTVVSEAGKAVTGSG